MPTDHRPVLSARTRQPGHDQRYRTAEEAFVTNARQLLPDRYVVESKPRDLRRFYGRLGLEPDAKVTDTLTGRYVFVEVKRQGPAGNAEERAYKHHTVTFARALAEHTALPYHAFVTVLCESLAELDKYTDKVPFHIEDGHFLLWRGYDQDLLAAFLQRLTTWMDPALRPSAD